MNACFREKFTVIMSHISAEDRDKVEADRSVCQYKAVTVYLIKLF